MDIFSLLLLKPGTFEWAKDFLTSLAWAALTNLSNGNSYTFSLPKSPSLVVISDYSCTDPTVPHYVDLEDDELNGDKEITEEAPGLQDKEDRLMGKQPMDTNLNAQEAMTPLPLVNPLVFVPRAKCGKQPIISDATLRRSERLHNNTKGFKSPTCKNKNCLGCSSNPNPIFICSQRFGSFILQS
jgi:hypothetical protein